MKKAIIIAGLAVLICSGVIGVTIKIEVDSFEQAKDKVIEWKDEVFLPLVERGFTIDKSI